MALQPNVNVRNWQVRFVHSAQHAYELHYSSECNFIQAADFVIIGNNVKIYVLVRRCVCRTHEDKHQFHKKIIINIEDFINGVEIHIDSRCCYRQIQLPDNSIKLEKVCFCPKGVGYQCTYRDNNIFVLTLSRALYF